MKQIGIKKLIVIRSSIMNRYNYDSLSTGCQVSGVYKAKIYIHFHSSDYWKMLLLLSLDRVLLAQSKRT